jgi:hypothetical protein
MSVQGEWFIPKIADPEKYLVIFNKFRSWDKSLVNKTTSTYILYKSDMCDLRVQKYSRETGKNGFTLIDSTWTHIPFFVNSPDNAFNKASKNAISSRHAWHYIKKT